MLTDLIQFLIAYAAGAATLGLFIVIQRRRKRVNDIIVVDHINPDPMNHAEPRDDKKNGADSDSRAVLSAVIAKTSILSTLVNSFSQKIEVNTESAISKFSDLLLSINNSIKGTTDVVDTVRTKMSSCVAQNGKSLNATSLEEIKERYEIMLSEIMEQFNLTIQRKAEDIEKLDHIRASAGRVKPFSDKIASIASSTRLISVNALIEAARAGEHGRTFAVVASEVRALADQSRSSAEEMDKSLNEIAQFIDHSITELKSAIDVESSFIKSTMVLLQDVVMSVVLSFVSISEAVEKTIGDSSTFRNEVNSIVFNLQFEDICHQMSQHTVTIMDGIRDDLQLLINGNGLYGSAGPSPHGCSLQGHPHGDDPALQSLLCQSGLGNYRKTAEESAAEEEGGISISIQERVNLSTNTLFTMEAERELAKKSLGIDSISTNPDQRDTVLVDAPPSDGEDLTFFGDQEADIDVERATDKDIKRDIEFDEDDDVTFF